MNFSTNTFSFYSNFFNQTKTIPFVLKLKVMAKLASSVGEEDYRKRFLVDFNNTYCNLEHVHPRNVLLTLVSPLFYNTQP